MGTVDDQRLALGAAQPVDAHDRITRQQPELLRDASGGLDDRDLEHAGLESDAPRQERIAQAEVAATIRLDARSGHERAPALVSRDEPALLELGEGQPERRAADAKGSAKLALRRQPGPGRPLPGADARLDLGGGGDGQRSASSDEPSTIGLIGPYQSDQTAHPRRASASGGTSDPSCPHRGQLADGSRYITCLFDGSTAITRSAILRRTRPKVDVRGRRFSVAISTRRASGWRRRSGRG